MATVVVLGAGFAGQTAALYLADRLGRDHKIVVVTPYPRFTYIPSLVWVGVGSMAPEKTQFELQPVYDRYGIDLVLGRCTEIYPDNNKITVNTNDGQTVQIQYDYLLNATGPYLNFAGTPGLGPDPDNGNGNSHSICNIHHAKLARDAYLETVKRMEKGEKQRLLIGTGHPLSTCQGAAFEYINNIHSDLVKRGLRDKAEIMWISNEPALGDFGVNGLHAKKYGFVMHSSDFAKSLYAEKGFYYQIKTGVKAVEKGKAYWEDYDGVEGETEFDFAMLIPQFKGIPIKYIDKDGNDITSKMCNPAGFMFVDGVYGKAWADVTADDWPSQYQSPHYKNIFAAGIAFAPPAPISKPFTNKNGLQIIASPPRTGMAAGIIGRIAALNIADMVQGRQPSHHEPMSRMPGACIASIGQSLTDGSAATILIYPVVPDFKKFPEYGRDLNYTYMDVGLAGAWIKYTLHHLFTWKMKGNLGWSLIPE